MQVNDFLYANSLNFLINLAYALAALLVASTGFQLIDKFVFKNIDLIDEIKKGNMAAAVFGSMLLAFVGLIVGLAMKN